MLGLGEYIQYGNFENSDYGGMMWIFFILATFVSTLLFLNAIISIMGNTYGEVKEF